MKLNPLQKILMIGAAAGCFSVPAWAGTNTWAVDFASQQIFARMNDNLFGTEEDDAAAEAEGEAPRRAASTADLSYRVDPAIRRRVEQTLLRDISNKDATAGQNFAAAIRDNDFVGAFDKALQPLGLQSGNVLDALVAHWMVSWGAANKHQGRFTREQVQGVKRQILSHFDVEKAGLGTPEARQFVAETLIYQTVLMDAAVEEAQKQGDQANLQLLSDTVQQQLQKSGMNLRALDLTDAGFVAKGAKQVGALTLPTGEAGATATPEPQALASAAPDEPDEGVSMTQAGLIGAGSAVAVLLLAGGGWSIMRRRG